MRILLVEDDQKAARLLVRGLHEEGFVVDAVASAESADEHVFAHDYELLILDWMLPGADGLSLCRRLRERGLQAPILMLTARDALSDRVAGLNTGADDYLTKPFAFDELLARVRALLRRSEVTRPPRLVVGDLLLDPVSQQASRNGKSLELTRKEFAILQLLMRKQGEVVGRSQLAEQVWHTDLLAIDNVIDVHLSNLRRKLAVGGDDALIQTVRGRGYKIQMAGSAC